MAHCSRASRERPRDDIDAGNFATPRAQQDIKVIGSVVLLQLVVLISSIRGVQGVHQTLVVVG